MHLNFKSRHLHYFHSFLLRLLFLHCTPKPFSGYSDFKVNQKTSIVRKIEEKRKFKVEKDFAGTKWYRWEMGIHMKLSGIPIKVCFSRTLCGMILMKRFSNWNPSLTNRSEICWCALSEVIRLIISSGIRQRVWLLTWLIEMSLISIFRIFSKTSNWVTFTLVHIFWSGPEPGGTFFLSFRNSGKWNYFQAIAMYSAMLMRKRRHLFQLLWKIMIFMIFTMCHLHFELVVGHHKLNYNDNDMTMQLQHCSSSGEYRKPTFLHFFL